MPTQRILERPADQTGFNVKVDGEPVSREYHLMSVSVVHRYNKVSYARLVYLDGAPSEEDFPLSNQDIFVPGREVEITAGGVSGQEAVFNGIVTRHSIRVRGNGSSQLLIECRHQATRLTVGRKNAYFYDMKDSEIISGILSAAGLEATVEETAVTHKEMIQYYATDWDFLLLRAVANGRMIFTRNGQLHIKRPEIASEPAVSLLYGATIYELDAEIDARYQYEGVRGITWDPAEGALAESEGEASVPEQGNLDPGELSGTIGLDALQLRHGGAADEPELKAWADARLLHSRLGKIRGSAQVDGITSVLPGDTVKLDGIGERFSGNALATGVRHDLDPQKGWKTTLEFGCDPEPLPDRLQVQDSPAAGLLPPVNGLHIGIVVSNEDPEHEDRVQVRMPLAGGSPDGIWARVASLDAGKDRGMFFRPEIGDEVILGFINDDPRDPVILGMLHSSLRPAPLQGSDANHEKGFVSRSRMKVLFDDEKKILTMETPAGNRMVFSEEDTSIVLEDQNGNKISMTPDGIKLESIAAIELKAPTDFKLQALSNELKADTQTKVTGSAGVEVSSGGTLKIQGSIVQIN